MLCDRRPALPLSTRRSGNTRLRSRWEAGTGPIRACKAAGNAAQRNSRRLDDISRSKQAER